MEFCHTVASLLSLYDINLLSARSVSDKIKQLQ